MCFCNICVFYVIDRNTKHLGNSDEWYGWRCIWTALTIGWQSVRCERANENNESVTTSAGWNQVKNIHFIFIFTLLSFASLSTEGVTTSAGLNQVKLKPWCILFFSFINPYSFIKNSICNHSKKERFNVEMWKENQLMTWWTNQHAIHSEALERLEI